MTSRIITRSHKNADKIVGFGYVGTNFGKIKIKRNKKRSSDVGTIKSHQCKNKNGRKPFADVTNNQTVTNIHGGGIKRLNTGRHKIRRVSTQSVHLRHQSDSFQDETEVNTDMQIDTEEKINNEKIDKLDKELLADMTNNQSGTNARIGGSKRLNTDGHTVARVSTQSLNDLHESDLLQEQCEVNTDMQIDNDMQIDIEEENINIEKLDNEDKKLDHKDEKIDKDKKLDYKKVDKSLLAIDLADIRNPQAASEYVHDIMIWCKKMESRRAPIPHYMKAQIDINSTMREILIDWLSEVHLKFKLRLETMYLAVNLMDRFLSVRHVSKTKLQLVGCTALLIASKYEEIYPPEVRHFVYISDNAYVRSEILMMECIMLNTLGFNLTIPTALRFGQRFMKFVTPSGNPKTFKFLVLYLMELTLQSYEFLRFFPSMIAASAIYLALQIISDGRPPIWNDILIKQTHYDVLDLKDCVTKLRDLATTPTKYRAVRKKYTSTKRKAVATIKIFDACNQGM